ncbi:MAG: SPFH domain-containing protein [Fimbriimonadaceae bacterium]|nr:SPFH domain-containing protein [Fimbriimonadaceae bacterium]
MATIQLSQEVTTGLMIGGGAALVILIGLAWIKSFLHICPPNEVLIFSGRRRKMADGSQRGFRPIFGGRGWRMPIVEKVDRMSLSIMEVPIQTRNAYSKGGIPLAMDAIANVKISSDPQVVGNAIERFLGRDPAEIRRVAKETLEGHLRGVLARLTPEEVNEDRLKFADELLRESELDLNKLGIHLDTLKIQHVSDEVHYLDSIGREAIANVVMEAEIAESDMKRQAELAEAENDGRARVIEANVQAQVLQMRNELRRIQAELESEVRSEEERTLAAAREARAKAEQELQQVRAEVEGVRLHTDQVLPAEAQLVAQEYRAKGDAAILRERGIAVGQALEEMNSAWLEAGDQALAIYLIEEIEKILGKAAKGVAKIKIDNLDMIDSGDGKVLSNYLSVYPEMLGSVLDAVTRTTGLDIRKAISQTEGEADSLLAQEEGGKQ